jgi:hypothetical protein
MLAIEGYVQMQQHLCVPVHQLGRKHHLLMEVADLLQCRWQRQRQGGPQVLLIPQR